MALPLAFLIFASSCRNGKEDSLEQIKDKIKKIAPQDRQDLEVFFEILMKHNDFGYSLFGEKPVSFDVFPIFEQKENIEIDDQSIFPILVEQGWKTWEKYAHLFPSKKFLLMKHIYEDRQIFVITIVNKFAALNVVKQNIDLFKDELGDDFSVDNSLELFSDLINLKHNLLGVLLGYGPGNARDFQRNDDISKYYACNKELTNQDSNILSSQSLEAIPYYSTAPGKIKSSLLPSEGYVSLAEEYNELRRRFTFFELEGTDYGLSTFYLPSFISFENNDENLELNNRYIEILKILIEKYQNNTFLEPTLEQWTKG